MFKDRERLKRHIALNIAMYRIRNLDSEEIAEKILTQIEKEER